MQANKHNSTHQIARVAGILFLLSLLVPTLNWGLIIFDSTAILFPCYAGILSIQISGSVPVSLSRIIFGLWLSFKGIKTTSDNKK